MTGKRGKSYVFTDQLHPTTIAQSVANLFRRHWPILFTQKVMKDGKIVMTSGAKQ